MSESRQSHTSSSTELTFLDGTRKSVESVLDQADGVHLVIKDAASKILWCNRNFAELVGQPMDKIIGSTDPREEHVAHDKAVLKRNEPILNLHESIEDFQSKYVPIVTQKGIVRVEDDKGKKGIGVTVCFSKEDAKKTEDYWKTRLSLLENPLGGFWAPGTTPLVMPDAVPLYSFNFYMLVGKSVLKLHKLVQDEQWFFHSGLAIRLHIFYPLPNDVLLAPKYECVLVGGDYGLLQYSVPGGTWFGADLPDLGFSLSSCSLAPGWTASSSSVPQQSDIDALTAAFKGQPDICEIIERLTLSSSPNSGEEKLESLII